MKRVLIILIIVLLSGLIISCGAQKRVADSKKSTVEISDTTALKDSTKYELIVFDPGFDFWFQSRAFTKNQYSNDYLQSWNHLYSMEWNRRYSSGDEFIDSYLEYDYLTSYDFEFNFKLYMFFKYFEEKNRLKLLPGSRSPL
ncbi:MAG: DUF6146 family protein [Bacteroidales bacterium]|nr:DUF6146 family protein [Bacteroidales bacterium]MDD2425878.1 DUF6146 family protein [Bacteroidales bacterium]MDD3989666.1 DUF6146 family protein [Bacteroidales bacterium]MDD4638605.1 DUF6146 family protein [Bacteroidales bacterium]